MRHLAEVLANKEHPDYDILRICNDSGCRMERYRYGMNV